MEHLHQFAVNSIAPHLVAFEKISFFHSMICVFMLSIAFQLDVPLACVKNSKGLSYRADAFSPFGHIDFLFGGSRSSFDSFMHGLAKSLSFIIGGDLGIVARITVDYEGNNTGNHPRKTIPAGRKFESNHLISPSELKKLTDSVLVTIKFFEH